LNERAVLNVFVSIFCFAFIEKLGFSWISLIVESEAMFWFLRIIKGDFSDVNPFIVRHALFESSSLIVLSEEAINPDSSNFLLNI
jgi:hypothetical protein